MTKIKDVRTKEYQWSGKTEQGFIDLNDDISGLGLNITDKYKSDFKIIE